MKVISLQNAPLRAFCNTFDLYLEIIRIENQFLMFFLSGRLRQVLLYSFNTITEPCSSLKTLEKYFGRIQADRIYGMNVEYSVYRLLYKLQACPFIETSICCSFAAFAGIYW